MRNRRFGQLATALVCALSGALVDAACLDIDASSSPCRYPAGDAWCARNDGANLYAYKDGCVDEGRLAQTETPARAPAKAAPGDPVAVWDCAKARTDVERLICANPDIRARDARMGVLYTELQALGLSPERMQKAWLRNERAACGDADCLRALYAERIRYFESLLQSGAAERKAVRDEPDSEPVAPIADPPAPDTEVDRNPALPPATEPAPTDPWASSSEATLPTDEPVAFLPELPQPELPSAFSGDASAVGGMPGSSDAAPGQPGHQAPSGWLRVGVVAGGAAALILAIGLFAWLRRTRIRGAVAVSSDHLASLLEWFQTVSADWFAVLRRLRAPVRAPRLASSQVSQKPSRPAEPCFSDEILARLHALARPGESLSSVLGRAVAALETASDQPRETVVLSRMAALEARLAELEGKRSTSKYP
ncbi:lysozyme inhibitor LprI family protein [Thiocapsa roseopersicina]|uniref:Uncharacterized protein n=1 Tax=Thiocapsa roseopersicina TaxID=1058 RepID=A0A1H3AK04_THIRO|nr:hypothetical protein [Thiocapsa roseopersicina]SDX29771.1 hypothetical protein SAMN05421783_12013 [Thiocapsa roseopersicina]